MGSCCCCAEENVASPPSPDEAKAVGNDGFWWRLGVCLVLVGLMMMLEVGLSTSASSGAPVTVQDPAYWWLHGGMIGGALVSVILLGVPLLKEAVAQWLKLNVTIESLFLVSALGAFVASFASSMQGTGGDVYYNTVAVVMVIYSVGRHVGRYTRGRALAAAARLRESFNQAWVRGTDGGRTMKAVAEVSLDDVVLVGPGEAVPVDGIVLEGRGYVQEAAMTGEPLPVAHGPGEMMRAGTFSQDGTFAIRQTALLGAREIDAVLDAVEKASTRPSRIQAQADRLMRWFFPLVLVVAAATFFGWWQAGAAMPALFHSMAVLLIACPCALGLATPIALWSALYRLSQFGLVSRSADLIEQLARADRFVFDKTGTLSREELAVSGFVVTKNWTGRAGVLRGLLKTVQARQTHPVAQAFQRFLQDDPAADGVVDVLQIPGQGIEAIFTENGTEGSSEIKMAHTLGSPTSRQHSADGANGNEERVLSLLPPYDSTSVIFDTASAGGTPAIPVASRPHQSGDFDENAIILRMGDLKLFSKTEQAVFEKMETDIEIPQGRRVYISVDGQAAAVAVLGEDLRESAAEALEALVKQGLQIAILTGDSNPRWRSIAGVEVVAGLDPAAKELQVRQWRKSGERVVFVGDGINDTSAMSEADAGIAMGSGTDLTQATAHGVLVGNGLGTLPQSVRLARQVFRSLRGNLLYALIYNIIGMALAAAGVLNPVVAALIMMASSAWVSWRAAKSAELGLALENVR